MARKKKHSEHVNHERWIVSYADFVTLLFAFFVVMFATAKADRSKASIVSAAVRAALNGSKPSDDLAQLLKASGKNATSAADRDLNDSTARMARAMLELRPSYDLLEKELKPEIKNGTVEMHMSARGLTISFKQAAFFDSGSDALKPSAFPTISKVGKALLKIPNFVRLEGHTDNVPISNGRFSSNWILSSSRGIAVLDMLANNFLVPRARLAVGGYADVAPVASNSTEEGRARNRRVDVVILSEYGNSNEPPQLK
jgi:chemotaxis protein MotB